MQYIFCHNINAALVITSCGLTLDAEALLVLNDEILLVVLELAQIILSVLGQEAKLLKSLIDLLVFLRHAVHHSTHWGARLPIKNCDTERESEMRESAGLGSTGW